MSISKRSHREPEVSIGELPSIHVEIRKQIADFETEATIFHISGYNLNECLAKLIIVKKMQLETRKT